jgi:hypothetical protein
MTNRYFWGTPHTDTDVNTFEAAFRDRAFDTAAGKFAAADAADRALETLTRRSSTLLQFNVLLAGVTLLFAYKLTTPPGALFLQFSHWGFVLALVSSILLVPNLALIWPSAEANIHRSPREAYLFSMSIYKMRAARYTIAIVASFLAIAFALISITQVS